MNLKTQSILFLISLATIVFIMLAFRLPAWFLLLPIGFFITQLVLGAIYIQRNFYIDSINQLSPQETKEKKICLTFDDGIHPQLTPRILDILKSYRIPAMFFVIGKNLSGHENILRRMQDEGHVIGNHSDQHTFWFDMQSADKMLQEIQTTNQAIERISGNVCRFFRPPYGVTNPNLAKAVRKSGLRSVGWNARSLDTTAKSKEELLQRLKKLSRPGSIVLLHDRCQVTADALTEYIDYCVAEGYTFVTL